MSFSINKVKESLGLSTTPDIYRSVAVKQFPGAFSMGTSKRPPIFSGDLSIPGPGAYDINSKNSLPKWKFASSGRKVFTSDQNPSPMAYSPNISFGKGPHFSFGVKPEIKIVSDLTGPGSYDPQLSTSNSVPCFSFGYKASNIVNSETPGPGSYYRSLAQKEQGNSQELLPKIQNNHKNTSEEKKKKNHSTKHKFVTKSQGFSTSQRDDFYNKEYKNVPGPGTYQINYKANHGNTPSFKFITGPKGMLEKLNKEEPGPGHFFINDRQVSFYSPKFTISHKYKNLNDENISARNNPGPGAYDPKIIAKTPNLRFQKASKNLDFSNENPGPGYYEADKIDKTLKGISFTTGKRYSLDQASTDPGPGHYEIVLKPQGPKVPILGKYEIIESPDKITPGPGKYLIEEDLSKKMKTNGVMASKSQKKSSYINDSGTPGPGKYNIDTSVEELGPKYTFGTSFRKSQWKKHYDPGPGSYDIPSTIAGIPNYLLNNTHYLRSSENSKYSEYIQEINESLQKNEEEPN